MTNQPAHVPNGNEPLAISEWLVRALFFALLVTLTFTAPSLPANDLDSSWRMALGRFFLDGLQVGRDVVFTYGPLGYQSGKTYFGELMPSMLLWQFGEAVTFSILIFRQGYRLAGYYRIIFFGFFVVLGVTYTDALHQMMVALAGFELLRRAGTNWKTGPILLGGLLAVLSLVKFTDLVLSSAFVLGVAGFDFWHRRPAAAFRLLAAYFGVFLGGWILCGQDPFNLPAYLYNSWEISQGYSDSMGLPAPTESLRLGLVVLGLFILYALIFLFTARDRARARVATFLLGAYTYLNWKHGFVRADGHMIGFFYCVFMPASAFPVLLGDSDRLRWLQRPILVLILVLSVFGMNTALPGLIRARLGGVSEKIFTNADYALHPAHFLQNYTSHLETQRAENSLPNIRAIVKNSTIDVLGYEQAVALFNDLNYAPRPVFQSYITFRPHLARLNFDYYASDRAPEFVLLKLQTIDYRLPVFDDSEVLRLLVYRYKYVTTELGFQLWQRKPGAFDPAAIAPHLLRSATVPVGQPLLAEDLANRPLWANVDLQPSLLGRLRAFFYKSPIVTLRIQDTKGISTDYRMPVSQGRTGFIINPVVEDIVGYMRFAGGPPERRLRALTVAVSPQDRDCFAAEATITLSELPPSDAGKEFFLQVDKLFFHMFKSFPVSYQAQTSLSEGTIDRRPVMVLHAPSSMQFELPVGARDFIGAYGFMPGAYSNGRQTDGAIFSILWVLGNEEHVLHEQMLDPVNVVGHRDLQNFRVKLPNRSGGHLVLRIDPGPKRNLSWDWTAWTELEFK